MNDNVVLASPLQTLLVPNAEATAGEHVRTRAEWTALGLTDEHLHALLTLGLAHSHDAATLGHCRSVEQRLTVTPLGWRVIADLIGRQKAETSVISSLKPEWKASARQLWYGPRLIKIYRHHAPNQMTLLDGFQRAGWPAWMTSPLPVDPYDNDAQVLRDTVKNANYGHRYRVLRFTMDIRHRYVGWRLVTATK